MKNQITPGMLEHRLRWLNRALNRPLEPRSGTGKDFKANAGNFSLSHENGGWRIEEQTGDGGVTIPFGTSRHTKAQIVELIDALLAAIVMARKP